jgi:hypothetical protein
MGEGGRRREKEERRRGMQKGEGGKRDRYDNNSLLILFGRCKKETVGGRRRT